MFVSFIPIACRSPPHVLKHKSSFKFLSHCSHDYLNQLGMTLSINKCSSLNILSTKSCAFTGGVEYTLLLNVPIERNHRVLDLVILEATQPNSLQQ